MGKLEAELTGDINVLSKYIGAAVQTNLFPGRRVNHILNRNGACHGCGHPAFLDLCRKD